MLKDDNAIPLETVRWEEIQVTLIMVCLGFPFMLLVTRLTERVIVSWTSVSREIAQDKNIAVGAVSAASSIAASIIVVFSFLS